MTTLSRFAAALLAYAVTASLAHAAGTADCHVGSYRMSDGSLIDIAPSDGKTLRWRRFDGTTGALHEAADEHWGSTLGWTHKPDGKSVTFTDCAKGDIRFDRMEGHRIALDVTNVTFKSHGVKLAGRLVLPKDKSVVPIVVLVHGAERESALKYYAYQRMFPVEGVGVFVYDKRGTGLSGGTYTQNFSLLADDAVAAMHEARKLAGKRAGRTGYQGGSQGGWIVPIAANRAHVDFAIISFGLAVTVLQEDQEEVEIEMREKGHSPAEITKALEVARAAEDVIASGFTKGFKRFDTVRAKYRNASWYKDLHGNFTFMLLPYSEKQLREMGPKYNWGTPFRYEPMPTLRANKTPQLWVLGTEDYEAPSAVTSRRIKSLIADGKPFTLALYPGAEHGMTLFEKDAKGERHSTRYAPGYFAMMRDFIRFGRLPGHYGDAAITRQEKMRP